MRLCLPEGRESRLARAVEYNAPQNPPGKH